MGYGHGGWVSALAAGGLTWFVATYFIGVSGASRELTEGFGSLFAAIILISIGIWMHGKSNAEAWQRYIKEKISAALRSEEHTSELQSLMRISYAVFWLKKNRAPVRRGRVQQPIDHGGSRSEGHPNILSTPHTTTYTSSIIEHSNR